MAILKDTILVATATLGVGSALMEIPSKSESFNKFFPYVGTFLSAGIGYYFLRRKGYIKAAEYQPSQDMDDYSLNEIAKSSAIEGFEPMKFSVVGNRAEGLETIFDAEGSFGDKPSINLSWKSYDDANEENKDKLALFNYLSNGRVLAMPANDSIKDKKNIEFDVAYPKADMNYTNMDLRGYFDFNGGRFYLIKYDYYTSKFKVKKGQPNFMVSPSYLVLYSKYSDYLQELRYEVVSGASNYLSRAQLEMVQPLFNGRQSFKNQYRKIIAENNIAHLGFRKDRRNATSEALQYLYFNCLTPELELDFDETLEVASNEFGIEAFQNMIIPYTYKVKDNNKKTRKITNYYYVDENGKCNFFIAICINEEGTLRFMGDTKTRNGMSKKIPHLGAVASLTKILEYRPILKYWLKSVVMDSANLSKRRINMWNSDREKWLKQQYMPMLTAKWLPLLYSRHTSLTALDYIRFMKSCLISTTLFKEENPATHAILMENPNDLDDNIALELFKKYYSSYDESWTFLAFKWNRQSPTDETHAQFYNNINCVEMDELRGYHGDFNYSHEKSQMYSILNTDNTKNTIVPIASWFSSGMPNVLPLEINNTKDLKVRAFRKIYNKREYEFDWVVEEKNSYYTNEEVITPPKYDYDPKRVHEIQEDYYDMLKNMINDPMEWPNNPFMKKEKYKGYYDPSEMEAESESNKKPHSVTISRSSNSEKKLMAVFEDSEGKKIKTTHFGQRGASDYTKHGDKERMQRYLERHGGGTITSTKEDWKDPTTAGSLSRWILWNKPSLSASFNDYKSRFGLKGSLNVSKSAEERKCKSCEKPATTVVQEGSFCYECLPINLGAENQPLCANKPCIRIANGTDGIGFCMPCEDDASNNRLIKEATEWVGFCPECNKWRTKQMSIKIDNKINTTGWSIPDKLLGKRLCKKSQRFGKIRQSGDSFTGYGSRPFDDSYCGTPLTKVKSKYKAEYEAKSPAQKSLDDWNDEDWKTKSGKPSGETGERFLPTKAIESLTDKEYKETSDKKRKDSKKGKQFSDQPKEIAEKTAKYRASEQNNAYSKYGINDKLAKKEPPMIFIQSYDNDHNGDEMLDNIIYNNFTLVSYAIWFKYKVAKTWKGLECFDIKLIPLTKNSYKIVILMKGKSLYQNKVWKIATNYDYEEWPFNKSPQGSEMGYDHDADAYYVGFRFYVEPDTMQAEHYKKIWDAYEQSKTETFEAIEGTGSKARFTDTPDSKVYRDTSLRQKARNSILKGTKGGNAGQWSAIKANLSASKYRSLYENKYGEGKNPYF